MFRELRPEKVYVTEDVYGDDRAVACVQGHVKVLVTQLAFEG